VPKELSNSKMYMKPSERDRILYWRDSCTMLYNKGQKNGTLVLNDTELSFSTDVDGPPRTDDGGSRPIWSLDLAQVQRTEVIVSQGGAELWIEHGTRRARFYFSGKDGPEKARGLLYAMDLSKKASRPESFSMKGIMGEYRSGQRGR